jgi:hypothetical protein
MRNSSAFVVVSMLMGAGLAAAQTSPSDIAGRMETSTQRQIVSVARMKTPVDAQAQSVAKQARPRQSGEFFLLPPPPKGPPLSGKALCDPLPIIEVDELVTEAGDASSVSPDLLRSVIRQESGFRPCAVSDKGAMGLMQLMETTASDLGVKDPFDPKENVTAGAKFLKQLINLYNGDLTLALSAYNAGAGRVNPSLGIPRIPETMDYVNKILSAFESTEPAN